ncbi:MAG: hypothetical protein LBR48_03110 [Dysgonamonadaceae bacterium]|jgi:hypothetical protein|nr:hypothetical protein [Dysgonamonadaceae bacterium]
MDVKTIIKRKSFRHCTGRLLAYCLIGSMATSFPACDDKLNNGDSDENSSGVGLVLKVAGVSDFYEGITRAQIEPQTVAVTTDEGFVVECTLAPEPAAATRAAVHPMGSDLKYRAILFNADFSKRTNAGNVTGTSGTNQSFLRTVGDSDVRLMVPWWSNDPTSADYYVRAVAYSTSDSQDPDGRELDTSPNTYTLDPGWDFLYAVTDTVQIWGYGHQSVYPDAKALTLTFHHQFTHVQNIIDITSIPGYTLTIPSGFTYTVDPNKAGMQTFAVNGPPTITTINANAVARQWTMSSSDQIATESEYGGRPIFTGGASNIDVTFSAPITVRHSGTGAHKDVSLGTIRFQGPLLTGTKYTLTVKFRAAGSVILDCDLVKFWNNGKILRSTARTLNGQTVEIEPGGLYNGGSSAISGTITATLTNAAHGTVTFTGTTGSIAAGHSNTTTIVLHHTAGDEISTSVSENGNDIPLTLSASGFSITTPTDLTQCVAIPYGLGAVRILFADNSGPVDEQAWGPNGFLGTPVQSTRSEAIIGGFSGSSVTGSVNFGPSGTVKTRWIPYTEGQIYNGGFDLRANNGSDAAQISAVCTNPGTPNPNVMVYATEDYNANIAPALKALINGGSWILYTTKYSSALGNREEDLGKVMTAVGTASGWSTTWGTITSNQLDGSANDRNPSSISLTGTGTAATALKSGPFGTISSITYTGNGPAIITSRHYLVGVNNLPLVCETIASYGNGSGGSKPVIFSCQNPVSKGGILVIAKNASASHSSSDPARYSNTGVPLSDNAKMEMNALYYVLEQSTAWDARNK